MTILSPNPSPKQRPRSAYETAQGLSELGRNLAARLFALAQGPNSTVAKAVARRLMKCADPRNVWHSSDQHNKATGELYNGYGTYWACHNRMCPMCSVQKSHELRKQARAGIARCGRSSFHRRWRSIVLTMPLIKGADLENAINRINNAFARLTNYKFWRSRVIGAVKTVEFTVRLDDFHVHIHVIVLSEYMPVNAEKEKQMQAYMEQRNLHPGNLADAMQKALEAAGVRIVGKPIVSVYEVCKRKKRDMSSETITLEQALLKLCNYLTKTVPWAEIPDAQLLRVAEVERWPRMFELLGAARLRKRHSNENQTPHVRASTRALVHNTQLSNFCGGKRKPRKRAPTWRETLNESSWDEWEEKQRRVVQKRQNYRREMLKQEFPYATFSTLDGEVVE